MSMIYNSSRIFVNFKRFNYIQVYKCNFNNRTFLNVNIDVNKPYSESLRNNETTNLERKSPSLVKRKINEVYSFYEEISGMDEVRIAQDKVILIQDELKTAQDKRREHVFELSAIRKDLQTLHNEILNCGRGESRYLDLVKNEIDMMQKEKDVLDRFQMADSAERELFSHLSSAVKMSHEKERHQANTVKYWSIIGSILGALLGIIASALSYRYRNTQFAEIKNQCNETVNQIIKLSEKIEVLKAEIHDLAVAHQKIIVPPPKAIFKTESWESYLRRKTVGMYRYFIPRR